MENARQIRNIVRTTFPAYEFSDSLKPDVCKPTPNIELASLECNWQIAWKLASAARDHNDHFKEAENALLTFCRSAQDVMSSAASNYNMERLCIGIFLAASAAVLSSVVSLDDMSGAKVFALFIAIAYGSMIFGSSYVEEEQQFWYWILSGWTFYLYTRRGIHSGVKRSDGDGGKGSSMPVHIWGCMVFAVSSRIMRRWNQTGQKFAAEPDIARTFFPSYTNVLWILILLTYTDICQGMVRRTSSAGAASFSRLFFPILTSFALLFKLSFTAADSPELLQNVLIYSHLVGSITGVSLITQARLVFTGIAIALVYVIYTDFQEKRTLKAFLKIGGKDGPHLPKHLNGTITSVRFPADLRDIVSLILVTQSRPTNIPLYLIFRLQHWALSSMELSGNGVTITSLILQYAAFFAMGGSNSIASVDLSNAYNGISNYNVVVVGILTFIGNWAGPIWWVFSTKLLFVNYDGRTPFVNRRRRSSHVALLTFFVTTSLLAVMVACTVLRTHLFIWTVFSPKFLYSMAWSLVQHLAINLLLGEAILKSIC